MVDSNSLNFQKISYFQLKIISTRVMRDVMHFQVLPLFQPQKLLLKLNYPTEITEKAKVNFEYEIDG